jgi:rRNA maturation RNase YbeY
MPNVQKDKVTLSIANLTKGKHPSLPFVNIKEAILGKNFELSLVFVGDAVSKKLNRTYREKNKPTNVLAFPLSKNSGEIFINLPLARTEAPKYNSNFKKHVLYLLIHGLLHLKGHRHGSKMDKAEFAFLNKFKL